MDRTVYIVVEGGVAHLEYEGPDVLRPGDTLRVEVRDFDLEDEDEVTGHDAYGEPYVETNAIVFQVASP